MRIARDLPLLLALMAVLPGCAYLQTAGKQAYYSASQAGAPRQRTYKHMLGRETYFVFGQIAHAGATETLAVVALSDRWRTNEVVDVNRFSRGDSFYGLNLPAGDYRLVVVHDADGDGSYDQREVLGGRRVEVGPATAPDFVLGDCDIDLGRRAVLGETRFRIAAPRAEPLAESVVYPRGTIRRLDDPIFAPQMATLGLYEPRAFLERAPMMFYALEEDVGYKIPVVFVHGIDGSPRDFAALVDHLDRTRYRPWFFYYPSGQDLGQLGEMFYRLFLSGKVIPLEEMPLVVVAHSMGGVVVREAMNRCTGRKGETRVAQLVTLASPLGGHPAAHHARRAPVVIPSWRDLDPASRFIRDLHRRPLPAETEYHLFYTLGEKPGAEGVSGDDGVVPLESQLTDASRREAAELVGVAASHVGILHDGAMRTRLDALLARVKSPFPEDHLRELRRGGYAVTPGADYTPLEAHLVRTIGHYMDALVEGRLQPIHPVQVEFIAAARGERPAKNPAEKAWQKLNRDQPGRGRD
jgi:pimeloyl-ACP methyl ester carboxylesterase